MLSRDLRVSVSRLRDILGPDFFNFYNSFSKSLNLPPENWRTKMELQQDLVNCLEQARKENYTQFFLAARKIQKEYLKHYPQENNSPISLLDYL